MTRGRALALVVLLAGLVALFAGSSSTEVADGPRATATIVVDDTAAGRPFDRRLLGTNLPAWVGSEQLADPAFVAATVASGTTVIRMPGGSWSDSYDWLACENRAAGCLYDQAARPRDYAGFLTATGAQGMWTVNVNSTAQSAAALVAYFNGSVDDERAIGVDRNGVDWQTVATWAGLRRDHGHPEPLNVRLWEVGNEVWAAKPGASGNCVPYGWENAWTCDGDRYVRGDAEHDGFLSIRSAMREVDADVAVGLVGVEDRTSWDGWGAKVLSAAEGQFDFYVLHHYGFDGRPRLDAVLRAPAAQWPDRVPNVGVPIAVTEYNLVAGQDSDTDALMTKAVDALYVADTIGQMATSGVTLANQWNLINGRADNGTDYGMLDGSSNAAPQYAGFALWQYAGETWLPVEGGDGGLAVYATRHRDGTLVLLVVNRSAFGRSANIAPRSDRSAPHRVAATSMSASGLDATILHPALPHIEGVTAPAASAPTNANVPPPPVDLGVVAGPVSVQLAPYSISVVELTPA